jgi:hypothetical protein
VICRSAHKIFAWQKIFTWKTFSWHAYTLFNTEVKSFQRFSIFGRRRGILLQMLILYGRIRRAYGPFLQGSAHRSGWSAHSRPSHRSGWSAHSRPLVFQRLFILEPGSDGVAFFREPHAWSIAVITLIVGNFAFWATKDPDFRCAVCLTPPRHRNSVCVEERINKGGMTNVGYSLHRNKLGAKIGTMVAGNSLHPGGVCGQNSPSQLDAGI